ncbi:Stp1/IreP family PP2C-type Ser/Thr phosphatase [Oculatella sp. LEGE 06141]|uniref:Stp1/IreP family PP2C-type Ser/Thr phosphatase n=1 Tax=Oculatella sp. LEGE 06141 TaxID=1828648 RepID=UPI001880FABE|nr:Stp1/IreP family PP2C-type Ser/Thr phosphatase [Oculatella sp. LEGE 06141]MBE9180752.1 Stp1/IreP family PP2C-type Ser/Thr phosphatase [Oculatella sp. LEGE 06141]
MKCSFTGLTDPGLIRSVNQDAYHIDPDGRFFIVADGMGGHAGGQEASRIATHSIQVYLDAHWESPEPSKTVLENAFLKANQAILQDQASHPERSDMGTTAVVVVFRDEQPWCAHIGDSRLYRLRGAKLQQITEDHTWVARALKMGELTSDQARVHPWRHILSKCLGREDLRQIDAQSFDLQPSDRLLLCSDGLTEELSDHLIASQLKSIRPCDRAAIALVDAAKEHGGRDNITVVIVSVDAATRTDTQPT